MGPPGGDQLFELALVLSDEVTKAFRKLFNNSFTLLPSNRNDIRHQRREIIALRFVCNSVPRVRDKKHGQTASA